MTTDLALGPRVAPLERRGLLARFAAWYARRRYGRVPGPIDAYAHSTALLAAVGAYELVAERARAIDPHLRGLAELKVAAMVGCPFCLDIGSSIARGHGVTEAQVRDLSRYTASDAFRPLERSVIDLAAAMTVTPVRVPDALFAGLRAELGERGVVELTGAIAWENYRARMNHALGLQAEGFSAGGACALPEAPDP